MDMNNGFEQACYELEIGVFEQPAVTLSASATETPIGILGPGPQAIPIGNVYIHTTGSFASSDAAYWLWQVYKRSGGGAQVLLAQGSTASTLNSPIAGGITAWKPAPLTVQAGAFVSPTDAITVVVTKTGVPANVTYCLGGFTTAN